MNEKKRHLNNAKILASQCRRNFYEVTGLDRSDLADSPTFCDKSQPEFCEQRVLDILFHNDENPYSEWKNMGLTDVEAIYNILKDPCINGRGTAHTFLICCKACLCLEMKPPLEELKAIIGQWTARHQDSEWAHLFNYMMHFPVPNGSLDTNVAVAKESAKKCDELVQKRRGGRFSRKSRPEYFLGRGRGLNAFLVANEISQTEGRSEESKTHFWRSTRVSEKLERLLGHKAILKKGVINYQGIQVRFDDSRYPEDSKDDLWFYLGFSVAGPYAYDPINNDTYESMKKPTAKLPPCQTSVEERDQHSLRHDTIALVRPPIRRKVPAGQLSSETAFKKKSSALQNENILTARQGNVDETSKKSQQAVSTASANPSYANVLNAEAKPSSIVGGSFQSKQVSLEVNGKSLRGSKEKKFKMLYEDNDGRVHHGAFVLGVQKSKECQTHVNAIHVFKKDQCSFAHSWKGDTLQHVCTKCSKEGKKYCREKIKHEEYIYNLGPYLARNGTKWNSGGNSTKNF